MHGFFNLGQAYLGGQKFIFFSMFVFFAGLVHGELHSSNLEQVLHVGCMELKGKLNPVSVYTIKGHTNFVSPTGSDLREMNKPRGSVY